ncbi:P-loop containing nucleoside triphosphate hydrolase protein [Pelagophyceae sp. CCMP2097]|nr:P-loop containing nucleoside triphosphate hydrolase protein [Pelagophyceae sp. CCMP2097]
MAPKEFVFAPANYAGVSEALVAIYGKKIRESEKLVLYDRFNTSLLSDAELLAKPMVLLIGQYSSGKTTFIRFLAGQDFPGMHIGPEPTTDGFCALMDGSSRTVIPGNAATSSKTRPFHALTNFGSAFLNKFCISELDCELTQKLTLIDTPGILAGTKQTLGRTYDYEKIVRWFADRSDLILLLFDAHKIDVSDELKEIIDVLQGHDEKMRLVLNKADACSTEEIMHVYGGIMWFLGKVFKTPEVKRSYLSSFWDQPLKNAELERFMSDERTRLMNDLYALPAGAQTRKVNEFVKRVRAGRAHCLLLNHLRASMPTFGQRAAKEKLIANLSDEFRKISNATNVPLNDFPDVDHYRKALQEYDFCKLPKADKKILALYTDVLEKDIPGVMAFFANSSTLQARLKEKRGWLHKQATTGKWQKRYFKVKGGQLEYFHKPENPTPAGALDLAGCVVASKPPEQAGDKNFCVRIETTERPYHLACESADDQAEWIMALQANCAADDGEEKKHSFKK